MAVKAQEYLAKLPKKRRDAIRRRGDELIAEALTLQQLRSVRRCSQVKLAKKLGIKQAAVSKLERRTNMYISTLRGLIEALGGTLEIVARFPDQLPVRIVQFDDGP